MRTELVRCQWCQGDELYMRYHDEEWGVPLHEDRKLFEFIVLEGAQAGLSWITVLRKRQAYKQAFDNFDFNEVAGYGERKIKNLLNNPGISSGTSLKSARRSGMPRRLLKSGRNSARSITTSGGLLTVNPYRTTGKSCHNYRQKPRYRIKSRKISNNGVSTSSAPPLPTRTCKPPAWSTITRRTAFGTRR